MIINRKISVFILIITGLSILVYLLSNSQNMVLEDKELDNALRSVLGNINGKISQQNLDTVTCLSAKGVSSLNGIEKLRKLKSLRLIDGWVKDLTPLAELHELNTFISNDNPISNLKPLSKLNKLSEIEISGSSFISDISPLSDLKELRFITLSGNICDIRPIKKLEKIFNLQLPYNNILEIPAGTSWPELTILNLRGNNLKSCYSLKSLNGLKEIDVSDNQLQNLDSLQSLKKLKLLIAYGNKFPKDYKFYMDGVKIFL